MTETIKHAAVKSKDGRVFMGKSHAECFWQGSNIAVEMSSKADDQGFVTSTGRFVNREEASRLAWYAKQINRDNGYLFSEDLWSPTSNGNHKYDYVKGYHK